MTRSSQAFYSVPTVDVLMPLNGFSPVVKPDAPGALAYWGIDERIAPGFRVDWISGKAGIRWFTH
jgi:hypothetical protein